MTTTTRDTRPAFHFLGHRGPREGSITSEDMGIPNLQDFPILEPAQRPYAAVARATTAAGFLWAEPKSLALVAQTYYGGSDAPVGPWPAKNATAEAWESAIAALPACVAERLWRGINRFSARFDVIETRQEVVQAGN